MIKPKTSLKGKVTTSAKLQGKTNASIIKEYPELEDIEIIPKIEDQELKSDMYGFNKIKVKGVSSYIDEDIQPEYIREGVEILGIIGNYKGIDTSDATATAEDILAGKTAYVNNEKIEGTIQEYDGSFEGNTAEGAKITDASYLFYGGARTDFIDEILSLCDGVTNMQHMFHNCASKLKELDLSNFDTSNVTSMTSTFGSCGYLRNLDLSNFNTSNVKFMTSMFENSSGLTELNLSNFDTSNVTYMSRMFYYCSFLTDLDISSFDMKKITDISNMFDYCSKLTNFRSFNNLGKGYTRAKENYSSYKLDLSYCENLTYDSLIGVLTNGLYDLNLTYDVANGGTLYTQSLVLGSTNLAKLTAEEIAIATNKGWTVS